MINFPDAAVGATVAALIAGIVSLLGLVISKEQKTSEFRQAWIDGLRLSLTAFLTQINAIHDATKVKYTSHSEKVETLSPLYIALNTSTFDILLRVNPNEANSKNLLHAMEAFNSLTADEAKLINENVRIAEREFLASSQDVLKSEWKRVKSGEWTFRIAKVLALVVILASVVASGLAVYTTWWSINSNFNQSVHSPPSRDKTPTSQAPAPSPSKTKGEN